MLGGRGRDVYRAGAGRDCVLMGAGNDVVFGGSGADFLHGQGGHDHVVGGPGRDRLSGGPGNDRIGARDGARDLIDCGSGRDVVTADRSDRVASNCERVLRPRKRRPRRHHTPTQFGNFPNAQTTGVPPGTSLSAYGGPTEIKSAGTVISGKTIGCIRVSAPGVVIRNSRITCHSSYAVYAEDGAFTGTPLTVEDSEVDCGLTGGNGFGEANITVRRVDVKGCENGFDINQNITIEDSYIHDLYNQGGAHTDGAQLASGHYENGNLVKGARNITFKHNTIFGMGADGSFGTSAIISNSGGDRDILIQGNLLAGGAVALYCEQHAKGTNYRVFDNHFTTTFGPKVGYYGISTECSDEEQSGNVHHESGKALKLH